MSEHETIITINDSEVKEGFFSFGTSKANEWNKLLKRVGGIENLISHKTNIQGTKITWFDAKVPIKFLSRSSFAIRKPVNKVFTEEQREAAKERFKVARANR